MNSLSANEHQAGATLIEVLVALLILAIGLLGYLGMQTQGIVLGRQAYAHSQAIFLAQDALERIRANRAVATGYAVNFGEQSVAATNCLSSSCSTAQMAAWDLNQWTALLAATLPSGEGAIDVANVGGIANVSVQVRYRLGDPRLNPGETESSDEDKHYIYMLEAQL